MSKGTTGENAKGRKRPNITNIKNGAKKRGFMNCNEKTTLEGLRVKNSLQRIYNKTMDGALSTSDCTEIQKAMKEFNKIVNKIVPKR